MTQSPGHKRHPNHKVRENAVAERLQVRVGETSIADSANVIEVNEDGHQKRYYFARDDVDPAVLSKSNTTSVCPFKGEARYYHLHAGGKTYEDALWSYEDPYDEHRALKDRLAFADDKFDVISIESL